MAKQQRDAVVSSANIVPMSMLSINIHAADSTVPDDSNIQCVVCVICTLNLHLSYKIPIGKI